MHRDCPKFYSTANIVEADDLFLGVVSLADNAEAFHCKTAGRELLYRRFCRNMICEHSNHRIGLDHGPIFHVSNN